MPRKKDECPSCGGTKSAVAELCATCRRDLLALPVEERYKRQQEAKSRYRVANPNASRDHYVANRERILERQRDYRVQIKADPATYIERSLRRSAKTLGIDPETVLAHYALVGNVCGACDHAPVHGNKRVAIDHDHATGEFRGFLCTSCNLLLGNLERYGLENIDKVVAYLNKA